jgi:hypothetical protein
LKVFSRFLEDLFYVKFIIFCVVSGSVAMAQQMVLARAVARGFAIRKSQAKLGHGRLRYRRLGHVAAALRNACGVGAASALLCITAPGPAQAITVNPGLTLQINYSVAGPNGEPGLTGAGGRPVDTLEFSETDSGDTVSNAVAQLYDGTTLLGTVDFLASSGSSFGFAAPGSGFSFGPLGTVTDWSSLINGTNDLFLDLTFSRSINISVCCGQLGVGAGNEILYNPGYINQPVFVSETVLSATPLPAALPLFASGLAALALFGWHRRKKVAAATA